MGLQGRQGLQGCYALVDCMGHGAGDMVDWLHWMGTVDWIGCIGLDWGREMVYWMSTVYCGGGGPGRAGQGRLDGHGLLDGRALEIWLCVTCHLPRVTAVTTGHWRCQVQGIHGQAMAVGHLQVACVTCRLHCREGHVQARGSGHDRLHVSRAGSLVSAGVGNGRVLSAGFGNCSFLLALNDRVLSGLDNHR